MIKEHFTASQDYFSINSRRRLMVVDREQIKDPNGF
jgi:hypothetical protein